MTFLAPILGSLAGGIGASILPTIFGGGGGNKKASDQAAYDANWMSTQSALAGGGGGGAAMAAPIDYYALYGAKAASENNPLTAAMQGLAILQGGLGGAIGQQGNTIASSQLTVLKEALDQAQTNSDPGWGNGSYCRCWS